MSAEDDGQCVEIQWQGRSIRLCYRPRYIMGSDHVAIRALDGEPLPVTQTGYRSYFFGPMEPVLAVEEVVDMVLAWLNREAASPQWRGYIEASRQLSLF
jgi:hypothetical protein